VGARRRFRQIVKVWMEIQREGVEESLRRR
jgi:hypothetical protein